MKHTLITLSSLCSLAVAQVPIINLPPRASCAAQCNAVDVCCIAACHAVPCPSGQQADETVRCVRGCPLGTGTPNDVANYTRCRENCILEHYYSASTTSTTSSSSSSSSTSTSSTSPSASASTTSSGDSSNSSSTSAADNEATRTESDTSATSSGAAAVNQVKMSASSAGLFGFLLASWAM